MVSMRLRIRAISHESERFDDRNEIDKGDEDHIELLESGEDAAGSLQPAEKPFYFVGPSSCKRNRPSGAS